MIMAVQFEKWKKCGYIWGAQGSLTNWPPQHVNPHPVQFSVFPSSHPANLFTRTLVVITFNSDICFGLVDIYGRWLEGNTGVGKEVEASCSRLCQPWNFFLWPQKSVNFYMVAMEGGFSMLLLGWTVDPLFIVNSFCLNWTTKECMWICLLNCYIMCNFPARSDIWKPKCSSTRYVEETLYCRLSCSMSNFHFCKMYQGMHLKHMQYWYGMCTFIALQYYFIPKMLRTSVPLCIEF